MSRSSKGLMLDFPEELILLVFKHLPDSRNLAQCSIVCKLWRSIIIDQAFSSARTIIRKEMEDFRKNPPRGCKIVRFDERLLFCEATIIGPPSSPYDGGLFFITVNFSGMHPFEPLKVKFQTKIYHPNVRSDGQICFGTWLTDWTPVITISTILLQIGNLLSNPDNPIDHDHEETARAWTMEYATKKQEIASS